jgi:hypothetical protein
MLDADHLFKRQQKVCIRDHYIRADFSPDALANRAGFDLDSAGSVAPD